MSLTQDFNAGTVWLGDFLRGLAARPGESWTGVGHEMLRRGLLTRSLRHHPFRCDGAPAGDAPIG